MWYINSMVFNSGDFKNGIWFLFRIPPDPPKGATVAAGAAVTAKLKKHVKNHVIHQFYGFQQLGFQIGISFSFRIPQDPPKGAAVATAVTAKIENICKKSCDTSILWFSTVGISRTGSVFYLGYLQTLPKALPRGGGWEGGWDLSIHHKRSCDISILGLLTVGISKMGSVFLLWYPRPYQPPKYVKFHTGDNKIERMCSGVSVKQLIT